MPAEFCRIFEQYNYLKDLEQEAGSEMSVFDQQVPQSMICSQETEIKPQIKNDLDTIPDFYSVMESFLSHESTFSITDTTTSKQHVHYYNDNIENNFINTNSQINPNQSSTLSLTSPSFFSSSSSPVTSSVVTMPSSTSSGFGTTLKSSPVFFTRDSPVFSELGESEPAFGFCTDYYTESESTAPHSPPEYTNMDKSQTTMFDGYTISDRSETEVMADEARRLEEAAIIMRDTIRRDSDSIKVPYDPMMWTPEHVRKWVSWVCQRNNVPDASPQRFSFDGSVLCSMNLDTFKGVFNDSGVKICHELELWKAANSCFSSQAYGTHNNDLANYESQVFSFPQPSTSPALSSCSSTHDSNSTSSIHSDHSDEESTFGSHMSPKSLSLLLGSSGCCTKLLTKIPSGRGHKQTIRLWQFLKELLLSKDCNYSDCIRWVDRKTGVFKIEDSKKVATLWGARKNRPAMNYDKLSRSVRQYYKKGIIKKTDQSKRLVYQFCAAYL